MKKELSFALLAFFPLAFLSRGLPVASAGVLPAGPEFRVNTNKLNDQLFPRVAGDPSGEFVVVWQGPAFLAPVGNGTEVFAQRFDSSGAPAGLEFAVNTTMTGDQGFPDVAADPGGNFVVVWQSNLQDGSGTGVFGQRFGSSGSPTGSEFRINAYTMGQQGFPAVASDANGDFVVVWQSATQDGSGYGIFGRQFGSTGAPIGPEFRVSSSTTSDQGLPSVAADTSGGFVGVWRSKHVVPDSIFGQRFGSSGTPLGGEFRVNDASVNAQANPSVSARGDGAFFVVWQDSLYSWVYGQQFMSDGSLAGGNFRVSGAAGVQSDPRSTYLVGGNIATVWRGSIAGGSADDVVGNVVLPIGEFRLNTYTTNNQRRPAVAPLVTGEFVVVWQSDLQDGSGYGVFGQRRCLGLVGVSIALTSGSATLCANSTGGTVSVSDIRGGSATHQWGYRLAPNGPTTAISGATDMDYVLNGPDFPGPGFYYLVCLTTPSCGTPTYSNELLVVTADTLAPAVTAPASLTVPQSLCQ